MANGEYQWFGNEQVSCRLCFKDNYLSIFFADLNHAVMSGKTEEIGIIFSGYIKPMLSVNNFKEIEIVIPNNKLQDIINCKVIPGFELELRIDQNITSLYFVEPSIDKDFMIFGHRGGAPMGVSFPAPENSLEIIGLAALYGANGVEIDIRLTKDEVPVLFHDENITPRTVEGKIIMGKISDFHLEHLNFYCRLYNGEKIPTLGIALDYILYNTSLKYVWLDCKSSKIDGIMKLQKEYNDKAREMNRDLIIYIGLPDEAVWDSYMQSKLRLDCPSICELSPERTIEAKSKIWSQRWTQGILTDKIDLLNSYGIKTVFWPVNDKEVLFVILNTKVNGVITDYPQYIYKLINE